MTVRFMRGCAASDKRNFMTRGVPSIFDPASMPTPPSLHKLATELLARSQRLREEADLLTETARRLKESIAADKASHSAKPAKKPKRRG
jgi:hypothetical protein